MKEFPKKIIVLANEFFSLFYNKRDEYDSLKDWQYYLRFGIDINKPARPVFDKEKLEKAYLKAWENRDFEINKFWTRAAYFWGFIVLIFGGYITILTGEHSKDAIKMHLDLYLLQLGWLFSVTWYLAIRGSKAWQRNWEAHIDYLENYVSGPIYKTVFYPGKNFYSVSKLNEVMSVVVIMVWFGLILQHILSYNFANPFNKNDNIDWYVTLSICFTILFSLSLRLGYCLGDYRSETNRFFDRWG